MCVCVSSREISPVSAYPFLVSAWWQRLSHPQFVCGSPSFQSRGKGKPSGGSPSLQTPLELQMATSEISLLVYMWLAIFSPRVFFCCPTINLCLFPRESSKLFAVINGIIVYCEGQHTALSLILHCSVHIQCVLWKTVLLCGCFWFARLEVRTAALLNIRIVWGVTLCRIVNSFRRFTVPSFLNCAAWSFWAGGVPFFLQLYGIVSQIRIYIYIYIYIYICIC